MKYVIGYDIDFDYVYQCEIEDALAERVRAHGGQEAAQVSDTPFPDIPVASRFKSVRHPGWPSPTGYLDSDGAT